MLLPKLLPLWAVLRCIHYFSPSVASYRSSWVASSQILLLPVSVACACQMLPELLDVTKFDPCICLSCSHALISSNLYLLSLFYHPIYELSAARFVLFTFLSPCSHSSENKISASIIFAQPNKAIPNVMSYSLHHVVEILFFFWLSWSLCINWIMKFSSSL
jgi:hypothetical protein